MGKYKNDFANLGVSNAYPNYARYYQRYVDMFLKMCNGRFKWNTPSYIPSEFIERFLIQNGTVLLFELFDKMSAWNYTSGGNFDIYGYPLKRNVTFVNGQTIEREEENSVIVYNNSQHLPDIGLIQGYASQLAQIDCAIDVNMRSCKTPILIKGSKAQLDSILKAYRQYDGDVPALVQDKDKTQLKDTFDVLDLKTTYRGNEFYTLKENLLREAYNSLGFYSVNNKRERLILDEVDTNNASINSIRYDMLKMRRRACEEFNEMTNNKYNISVDFASGIQPNEETEVIENYDGK